MCMVTPEIKIALRRHLHGRFVAFWYHLDVVILKERQINSTEKRSNCSLFLQERFSFRPRSPSATYPHNIVLGYMQSMWMATGYHSHTCSVNVPSIPNASKPVNWHSLKNDSQYRFHRTTTHLRNCHWKITAAINIHKIAVTLRWIHQDKRQCAYRKVPFTMCKLTISIQTPRPQPSSLPRKSHTVTISSCNQANGFVVKTWCVNMPKMCSYLMITITKLASLCVAAAPYESILRQNQRKIRTTRNRSYGWFAKHPLRKSMRNSCGSVEITQCQLSKLSTTPHVHTTVGCYAGSVCWPCQYHHYRMTVEHNVFVNQDQPRLIDSVSNSKLACVIYAKSIEITTLRDNEQWTKRTLPTSLSWCGLAVNMCKFAALAIVYGRSAPKFKAKHAREGGWKTKTWTHATLRKIEVKFVEIWLNGNLYQKYQFRGAWACLFESLCVNARQLLARWRR